MALIKPRIMPGAMELLPCEQIVFQRLLDTIRRAYERFGFVPIETPAMELSEILLTKSGGETERQVYFVQSTGSLSAERAPGEWPELALRFDLTVPLARYVAEHEHELAFPFRRYQIQRVYRGERAQRGRFREFYQCDIDVIGKDFLPLAYDAEIPAVIYHLFRELNFGAFRIQLNNRKLLRGFFERLGIADGECQMAVLREVDKLGKRGADYVRDTLAGPPSGLDAAAVNTLLALIGVQSNGYQDALERLDELGAGNEALERGIAEMREVLARIRDFGVPETHYALNFSIARGLDYYTGTVYETTLNDYPEIGSVCSGGRYDNLAGQYSKSHLPGVGISIGATRLFYQLREAGLIANAQSTVEVLVSQMDPARLPDYLRLASMLRAAGINTEVQLDPVKLAKQFKYADRAGIRFVLVIGDDEAAKGVVTVKDLRSQQQREVLRAELVPALRIALGHMA